MHCPFPGMDPYIERAAIWTDFHDRLITGISGALQPHLRPKYAALVQDRLFVVTSRRPIRPDVAVVETGVVSPRTTSATGVLELDQPVVFEMRAEEVREPFVQIIEPAAGNRLITAIEVLSPDNKLPGSGRKKYLRKRRELWSGHANVVEIDLLRAGRPTFPISAEQRATLPNWRYLVSVARQPNLQEIYAVALQSRLPNVAIPLTAPDGDVPLDLQAVFTRCWQDGPYPEMLRYDGPPPGEMAAEELRWCDSQLRQAGARKSE